MAGRVLVVDDDPTMAETLAMGLPGWGFETTARTSAPQALDLLAGEDYDVVVTDLSMGGMNGIELCERIAANRPDIPVVVMTAYGSLETAVAAIRAGAYDFVTKPFELGAMALTLERAVRHRGLQAEVKRLRLRVATQEPGELLGDSPGMRKVRDVIVRVADSDASVLVTGESGTGKELVARALHRHSRRGGAPFRALNCAALPETLLESELFGHVRGAFTDARTAHTGLFLQANGGTLFLDEIGDMPPGLQAKLLRALQERRVRPVGGESELHFDVRLVTATNRNLELAIEEGRFRKDLYFRINVINLDLPSLRTRGNDILLLAQHFLARSARQAHKSIRGLSSAAAERLLGYTWPGNVRELQNAMERAVAFARFEEVTVEDLPEKLRTYQRGHILVEGTDPAELVPLEEVERRYILRVLDAMSGSRTRAAQVLGLDRKTLYRKLEAYGHPSDDHRRGPS